MEHLTEVLLGLKKFLDNRTAMMQAMYREDVRQDFLMKEKLQSIDETGGVKVQPISSPGVDLSPVNDLIPNTSPRKAPKQPLVKAATGLLGGADVSNALNINATSMGTEPMPQPKTSLAKVGLEEGIKKTYGWISYQISKEMYGVPPYDDPDFNPYESAEVMAAG